jgi:hypothetical protein
MKEKLIAILKSLGLYTDDKKVEIDKALEAIEEPKPAPKIASTPTDESIELKTMVDSLKEQNKQLFTAIAEEKKAREASQKAVADQMKADKDKKITDALVKAEADGKISKAQTDGWKKILELDYETGSAQLTALPVNPAFKKADDKKADDKKGDPPSNKNLGLASSAEPKILDSIMKMANITDN